MLEGSEESQSQASLRTRSRELLGNSGDHQHKLSPFNTKWIYGYNPTPGVINLNDKGSAVAFYAASYCGVLYNWTANTMTILQGHRHQITCIACCGRGRWLVTADSGPENCVIIWDAVDYFPQKTLFNPHGAAKLGKLALSSDAKYLLTLAYTEKASLYWWIWSFGLDTPHAKLEIDLAKDSVLDMGFNPYDTTQFLLLTKHDIWFGVSGKMERGEQKETDEYELKMRQIDKKTQVNCGRFVCFTFVENTCQVLVGTNRGSILIYGYTMEYREVATPGKYDELKFVKALQVEKCRINVLKSIDGVIVSGNKAGEIHFYDDHLKLLYWMQAGQADCVRGLSFNISPRSFQIFDPKCKTACPCWEKVETVVDPTTGHLRQKLVKHKLPQDATTSAKPFVVRDFIVCTNNEGFGFMDFVTEKLEIILNTKITQPLSLSVHPEKPFICIGYADGCIDVYNFEKHRMFKRLCLREHYKVVIPPNEDSVTCRAEVIIPQLSVTCLKYSPSGLHLACGLNTGEMLFLDPATADVPCAPPHKNTSYEITEINFSEDSLTMAFADVGRTVGVYKYDCSASTWRFVGKHRAHYKDVSTVFFLPGRNEHGGLISVGADRALVEYDIGDSATELVVKNMARVEQAALPLTAVPWPPPADLDTTLYRTDLPLILMATSEFKYKIVNYATSMTLSTVLGPRYERPVRWMQLVSRKDLEPTDHQSQYLVFATNNTIGLQKLPLDGNPWKHVGLIAHPVQITQLCYREDLATLFTIGAKDCAVTQWAANFSAADTATARGGSALEPYYCLIEHGRPGWLFTEIRDLFYYIQILCQGTFSPAVRTVRDYVLIDSLPDMVRALGYFPSEYEVENLIVEAKYKVYLRSPATEIDFEEFVKLYVNHRPAWPLTHTPIQRAFTHFATLENDVYQLSREDLIKVLVCHGEHFSLELAHYLLSILSGEIFEEKPAVADNTGSEDDFSFLPEYITFSEFVCNLLGIQDMGDSSEQHSTLNPFQSGSEITTSTMDSE